MTSRGQTSHRKSRNSGGSGGSKSHSPPFIDLKEVIDSAKKAFEHDQRHSKTASSSPGGAPPNKSTEKGSKQEDKKSVSAPASPNKSLTVMLPSEDHQPAKRARLMRSSVSPKGRRSSLLMTASTATATATATATSNSTTSSNTATTSSTIIATSNDSTDKSLNKNQSEKSNNKKNSKSGISMSEVIRLHQDEGVMHLLHGLPANRRRPSTSQVVSVNQNQVRRRPSSEIERGPKKGIAQSIANKSNNSSLRTVLVQRMTNVDNVLSAPLDRNIKPTTQEELMTPQNMNILKNGLTTKDYVRLWSNPGRYILSRDRMRKPSGEDQSQPVDDSASQASPSGSVTSLDSSVSSAALKSQQHHAIKPFMRSTPWKLNTKNFKDVLIRTYSTFAQIIISPSTTGLKHSINPNVCEEFVDALRQLGEDKECRAILVTGIGGAFCNGVDYTILANEGSADKQRKNAEALANGIKKLVKQLLDTKQVLVAAVNGRASGLGVSILPYFQIVYASDKAEFSFEYAKLGHLPEAFASQTKVSDCREMLILGHTLTATMAQKAGLVNDVILPSKFLEEIVPKLESLEFMNASGLQILSRCIKKSTRERVLKVIDEETKELANQWSSLEFAKNVRHFIKSGHVSFI